MSKNDVLDNVLLRKRLEVHLETDWPVSPKNTRWANPINDFSGFGLDAGKAEKAGFSDESLSVFNIVSFLDVENPKSLRYFPTLHSTYCNIYAYDFCYLRGVYIPRVWWINHGIAQDVINERYAHSKHSFSAPKAVYGKTIREMTANSIHLWLEDYGMEYFGWERVATPEELQERADDLDVCLITAIRENRRKSGHVSVVIPRGLFPGTSDPGAMYDFPIESYAGRENRMAILNSNLWWEAETYEDYGFWANSNYAPLISQKE